MKVEFNPWIIAAILGLVGSAAISNQPVDETTSFNLSETNYLQNETDKSRDNLVPSAPLISMNLHHEVQSSHRTDLTNRYFVENEVTTLDSVKFETFLRNITALGNFKGEITESFLKRINPHWLYYPPQTPTAHYSLAFIYFVMMMFGLVGNFLVIFIYLRCPSVRTPANHLIFNLAISDFLIILEAPIFIYNAVNFGPASGELACKMYGMLGATGGTVAIMTLCAISIDRYNVIVYPLNPSRSTTNNRSRLMILFVWVYSLPFAVLPFLEIGGVGGYIPEGFLTACSFDYLDTSPSNYWFIFIYAIAAYFVPLTIIAYCYIHIIHVVASAKKIQSSKEKNKTEVKLAAIVMGIVGLWVFAWTPYCAVSLVGIFGYASSITPLMSMIPAILAKIAACADPYLYAVTHPRFRAELDKMFCATKASRSESMVGRRQTEMPSEFETVQMEDTAKRPKPPMIRSESSACEESTID